MFTSIRSTLKASLAGSVLVANVLAICSGMIPIVLLKLTVPRGAVRRATDRALNAMAEAWIAVNGWWMALVQRTRWDVRGVDGLRRHGWYLVNANHQSWVDILVLQKVFNRRVPFLKFFLKRELIYVPVIGLAWWALDFPFVRRKGGKQGRGLDLATTRKACERFKQIPTSVINFLEGTRFSRAKQAAQGSPYRHLLKPRVGGLATALGAMGERFDAMLDVTIHYPQGVPTFWDLLSGKVREVVVRVRELEIPKDLLGGDYERDPAYRARVQAWVQALWAEKDRCLDDLAHTCASLPAPESMA